MRGTIIKDVVQVSWNIRVLRAFGYPVFPEMAYSKDKAECARTFQEAGDCKQEGSSATLAFLNCCPQADPDPRLIFTKFPLEHVHLHITYGCVRATW